MKKKGILFLQEERDKGFYVEKKINSNYDDMFSF